MISKQRIFKSLWIFAFALLLAGCGAPQVVQEEIQVGINIDGQSYSVHVPAGSNVEQAIENASITINEGDKVDTLSPSQSTSKPMIL